MEKLAVTLGITGASKSASLGKWLSTLTPRSESETASNELMYVDDCDTWGCWVNTELVKRAGVGVRQQHLQRNGQAPVCGRDEQLRERLSDTSSRAARKSTPTRAAATSCLSRRLREDEI